MKNRFRLIVRGERGKKFYCVDAETGKRVSLHTEDRDSAEQIVLAKNQALRQPHLNLQIAKAYLAGTDSGVSNRNWKDAIEILTHSKQGPTKDRWLRVIKDKALIPLWTQVIIETKGETLLGILQSGTVSTNVYLRRLHNFCLDMNWLPWSIVPKRQWPTVKFKEKRAVTLQEHQRIIAAEPNRERKAFYQICWYLGASQGDIAGLQGGDVNWTNGTLSFTRRKSGVPVAISLGEEALNLFKDMPSQGPLFPNLSQVRSSDRATEFASRCRQLAIKGITLHSYRYAWAERAKVAGMPERFAQEALGHNSKAVHRSYAKGALLKIPSLEEYEANCSKIVIKTDQRCDK